MNSTLAHRSRAKLIASSYPASAMAMTRTDGPVRTRRMTSYQPRNGTTMSAGMSFSVHTRANASAVFPADEITSVRESAGSIRRITLTASRSLKLPVGSDAPRSGHHPLKAIHS